MINGDIWFIIGFLLLFLAVLSSCAWLTGLYIFRVAEGRIPFPLRFLKPIEEFFYRIAGVSPSEEQDWRGYAGGMLAFNATGFLVLLILLLTQGWLILNPEHFPGFSPVLAFNTAASFITNTNWQAYSGEGTASYLAQTSGFAVQNFLSAATGICISIAVMRGLSRTRTDRLGNFWVDVTRVTLYLLIPLCLVLAIFLVSQGVIQNYSPYITASPLDPHSGTQILPMGPVASQEAIKLLGTNGGGFFNANSAHPFENPTPWTNIIEVFSILLIAAGLPFTFGRMIGDMRQGISLYVVMLVLFSVAFTGGYLAESREDPTLSAAGVQGPSLEGKEVRFGLETSILFTVATTATSCGAVNTMHDSLTPLAGMVPLLLILLGEIVFGGAGSGLYTMIAFVLLAVFLAGLMIGRTPEYLGKKLDVREVRCSILAIFIPGVLILIFSSIALVTPEGLSAMLNPGAHGLTEVVYAYASMANNNGSAFAGLDADSLFYLVSGSLVMLAGRFVPAIAMLAVAGSFARKIAVPASFGTLPTHTPAFITWLIGVILIVGGLTFFSLLAAGPVVEQIVLSGGL